MIPIPLVGDESASMSHNNFFRKQQGFCDGLR